MCTKNGWKHVCNELARSKRDQGKARTGPDAEGGGISSQTEDIRRLTTSSSLCLSAALLHKAIILPVLGNPRPPPTDLCWDTTAAQEVCLLPIIEDESNATAAATAHRRDGTCCVHNASQLGLVCFASLLHIDSGWHLSLCSFWSSHNGLQFMTTRTTHTCRVDLRMF